MKTPLFAYAMHDLGSNFRRNEVIERESLLCYNSLITFPLKLRLSAYDDYRGELNIELEGKKGTRNIFTFYNKGITDLFLDDMNIKSFSELQALEDKRTLEGISNGKKLVWISAHEPSREKYLFYNELKKVNEKEKKKPERVIKIQEHFDKESLKANSLYYSIKEGALGDFHINELNEKKKKLEESLDKGISLLGECAQIMGDDSFSFPNFDKYRDFVNESLNEIDKEIDNRLSYY